MMQGISEEYLRGLVVKMDSVIRFEIVVRFRSLSVVFQRLSIVGTWETSACLR